MKCAASSLVRPTKKKRTNEHTAKTKQKKERTGICRQKIFEYTQRERNKAKQTKKEKNGQQVVYNKKETKNKHIIVHKRERRLYTK